MLVASLTRLALSVFASPSAKLDHLRSRPSPSRPHADAGGACSGTCIQPEAGPLHHQGGALSAAAAGSLLDACPATAAHPSAAKRQQWPHTEKPWRAIRLAALLSARLAFAIKRQKNRETARHLPYPPGCRATPPRLASTQRQGTPMSRKKQGSDCLVYPGTRELAVDPVVRGRGSLGPR